MQKKLTQHVADSLIQLGADRKMRRATTFMSPKVTVKVTRQRKPRANARQETFLLSVGSPNFLERRMINSGKIKKYPVYKYESFTKA